MELPVSVSDLQRALPHRPPMVWVDWVLAADKEGGTCAVDLKSDALYADDKGQTLAFAPIEWLAEAYGYSRACYELQAGTGNKGASRAFLAGVTELTVLRQLPATGRIILDVRLTREMLPLALVDGTVKTETGELIAKARLKLYFEY